MQPQFTPSGELFARNLNLTERGTLASDGETVHVSGVAGGLYFAYEQLRNIAEYTEQHLILRASIERFLRRHMQFDSKPANLGRELVEELTQERYLTNDSIALGTVDRIDSYVDYYLRLQQTLQTSAQHPGRDKAVAWTVQAASVAIEQLLIPSPKTGAFVDFAYAHCQQAIDAGEFAASDQQTFDAALYCAVHRALLKSDIATTRAYFIAAEPSRSQSLEAFVAANRQIDTLFDAPLANRLTRLISRNGGPLRIIREVVTQTAQPSELLANPAKLAEHIQAVAGEQYKLTHSRLVKSIIRTLVFVFITKVLIGLLLEIPYDLWAHDRVLILPLLVNLLFPPLYMATAIWSVKQPDSANTEALKANAARILYQSGAPMRYRLPARNLSPTLRIAFRIMYVLAYGASFGLAIWALASLGFSLPHMAIFFVFFSAVSFFRFRLIQTSTELEVNDRRESIFETIADFFYTPFIKLGEWLSSRYRRLNLITAVLDLVIEMPLKMSLRVLQEWVRFLRDRREGF